MFYNKIAISGSTGELGGCLVEKILPVENLIALGRNFDKNTRIANLIKDNKITPFLCDLTDLNGLSNNKKIFEDVDCLIHLAAAVRNSKDFIHGSEDIIRTNIFGSINLLRILPALKQIIFISTTSVYGINRTRQIVPISEMQTESPDDLYSSTKHIGEKLLKMYAEENKVSLCILRVSSVYSPVSYTINVKRAIQIFAEKVVHGESIAVNGDGNNIKDYIYIEDAVNAIVWALKNKISGIYNIASGQVTTLNTVLDTLFEVAGKKVPVMYSPANSQLNDFCCSSQKAMNDGFKYQYNLLAGLQKIISEIK